MSECPSRKNFKTRFSRFSLYISSCLLYFLCLFCLFGLFCVFCLFCLSGLLYVSYVIFLNTLISLLFLLSLTSFMSLTSLVSLTSLMCLMSFHLSSFFFISLHVSPCLPCLLLFPHISSCLNVPSCLFLQSRCRGLGGVGVEE